MVLAFLVWCLRIIPLIFSFSLIMVGQNKSDGYPWTPGLIHFILFLPCFHHSSFVLFKYFFTSSFLLLSFFWRKDRVFLIGYYNNTRKSWVSKVNPNCDGGFGLQNRGIRYFCSWFGLDSPNNNGSLNFETPGQKL